jgi:glycosyltransferase involved in cell wall biosynthesis
MTADTVGGVWTYAMELCGALRRHGVEVALATMGRLPSDEQRAAAHALPNARLFESAFKLEWQEDPWDDLSAAGQWLLGLEDRVKPDVVHLNGYSHGALPWRAPVLVVAHSCVLSWWEAVKREPAPIEWNRYRRAVRQGVRAADAVVAPSRSMLDAVKHHYGPLRCGGVIYNGRDAAEFDATRGKEPIVLTAGRCWDDAKNIAAIEAVAPHVAWPVHVAGEGRGSRGDWVHYLGPLEPPNLAQWMSRAAIYVLPARYEPFGLSALEAALSGCALVLGDIGSLREIWDDAAVFVRPDDHEQLAAVINGLIKSPSERAALGARARRRAAARFAPQRMARSYLSAYRAMLHTRAPAFREDLRCAS